MCYLLSPTSLRVSVAWQLVIVAWLLFSLA